MCVTGPVRARWRQRKVRRMRSPVRLLVALTVAAMLATFLRYTSLAGGATASLQPSQLRGHAGIVGLAGRVTGVVTGDAHRGGLRSRVHDRSGHGSIAVRYRGAVPDMFKSGRSIFVRGRVIAGVFVAQPDTLMTKSPSKYVGVGAKAT